MFHILIAAVKRRLPVAAKVAVANSIRFSALTVVFLALLSDAFAQAPVRNNASDSVGSTAGQFRVDEAGQATYTIPLVTVPGTAGVVPSMSLTYSSQGPDSVLGKGWSIGGTSAITRCRRSREAGDFFAGGATYDGDAPPINYSQADAFCLDGQRLLQVPPTSGSTPAYGAADAEYRLELDPWTRVYSRGGDNSSSVAAYTGPVSFEVQRRDGSLSLYGSTADSRVERNACAGTTGVACATSTWALARTIDSTGNYISYSYQKLTSGVATTAGTDADEYTLSAVRYTGKQDIAGQTGTARNPYAELAFTYQSLPAADWRVGWQAGSRMTRSQRLISVRLRDQIDTASPRTIRFYDLSSQARSVSGSGANVLSQIQECRDETRQVCYPPTKFTWSPATKYVVPSSDEEQTFDLSSRHGARLGDVDGDGRTDIVWVRNVNSGACATSRIFVSFADHIDTGARSEMTLVTPEQAGYCMPRNLTELEDSWQLFDYDGDGRDDLMVAGSPSSGPSRWNLYRSVGRPATATDRVFDTTQDLLAGTLIPVENEDLRLAQLADLNGDGLLDVLYPVRVTAGSVTSTELRGRLRTFDGASWKFGSELPIEFAFAAGDPCPSLDSGPQLPPGKILTQCEFAFGQRGESRFSPVELDGDGRGDLMVRVARRYESISVLRARRDRPLNRRSFVSGAEMSDRERKERERNPNAAVPANEATFTFHWYFFVSRSDGRSIQVKQYHQGEIYNGTADGVLPSETRYLQLVDVNGDGLNDLLYRSSATGTQDNWRLQMNFGNGFSFALLQANGVKNRDSIQFADLNGDGAVDMLYPQEESEACSGSGNPGIHRPYCVRYGRKDGLGLGAPQLAPGLITGIGQTASPLSEFEHHFADFDADGATDFVRIWKKASGARVHTSRPLLRHRLHDAIEAIEDGLSAKTEIVYQPMANASVHRRSVNSLNSATLGRGSPTIDMVSMGYVVSEVSSPAPIWESAAHRAKVGYRYFGAKLQSGGRGALGFASITSFDAAYDVSPAQFAVTRTEYRQDFPFVGRPLFTTKTATIGALDYGNGSNEPCRTDPEAQANCFGSPSDTEWATPSGVEFSKATNLYACTGTLDGSACHQTVIQAACQVLSPQSVEFDPLGVQQPIFPYVEGTSDITRDLASGNALSETLSAYCHTDDFGNMTLSKVEHKDGVGAVVATQFTRNAYDNNQTKWRLGRLTSAEVTDSLATGDEQVRSSQFAYELDTSTYTSPTNTGFLKSERIQPSAGDDEDLRKLYTLDVFGNRTHEFLCSAKQPDGSSLTDANCVDTSLVTQRPLDGDDKPVTSVHRYTKHEYDARGRYSISSTAPFYSSTAPRNMQERVVVTIGPRDEFGNITSQTDANGMVKTALFGALGRPYYVADSTGRSSTTTYAWCTTTTTFCPSGAVFRAQTVVSGGATQWTYHDVLGRPMLTASQSFNAGTADKDFSAMCSFYDGKGRGERSSEPFFLPSSATDTAPQFSESVDVCGVRLWNLTQLDLLGRTIQQTAADTGVTSVVYDGLKTTTTNAKQQVAAETKNALGQVIETTQPNPKLDLTLGISAKMEYDAKGNLRFVKRDAGNGNIITEHRYDSLGRKVLTIDPDRGTHSWEYNAAGEVTKSTNGRGQLTELAYDALGRLWRRRSDYDAVNLRWNLVDSWDYDTAVKGVGQLHSEARQEFGATTYSRTMAYDSIGRLRTRTNLIDGQSTTETTAYDTLGRPSRTTDATGRTLESVYTSRGFVEKLRDANDNAVIYLEARETNARGQVTYERRGNVAALDVRRTFSASRGWLEAVNQGQARVTESSHFTYLYDLLGNLQERTERQGTPLECGYLETIVFTEHDFDGLNRLTDSNQVLSALREDCGTGVVRAADVPPIAFPADESFQYDTLGNICSVVGEGGFEAPTTYEYGGIDGCDATSLDAQARPHALTRRGDTRYTYDADGNQTQADKPGEQSDRYATYNSLGQLIDLKLGSESLPGARTQFFYGPSGERYKRIDTSGSGATTTTHYIGSVERIVRSPGGAEDRRYLGGIAIERLSGGLVMSRHYLLADHLGSVRVISDATGRRVEDRYYANQGSTQTSPLTERGFTGHEDVDAFGLIHMNGRVYDPEAGRFLQPDPVGDVGIQGMNPYSYVLNNPVSLTDPTGYWSVPSWARTVAAIVITVYTGGYGASLYAAGNTAAAFSVVVAGGFSAGYIQSGSVKGGLYGAFSSALFFGVGSGFGAVEAAQRGTLTSAQALGRVVTHGIAGGVMSDLQGGKFGHGFVSAGSTQALGPAIDRLDYLSQRVVASAILGGTVSAATGGKFANGALTAAFSYAFGDLAESNSQDRAEVSVTGCGSKYGCASASWGGELPDYFSAPPDEALDSVSSRALAPLKLKADGEWIGYVQFRGPVGYIASKPKFMHYQVKKGNVPTVSFLIPFDAVAIFHTHPYIPKAFAFNRAQSTFGPGDADVVYSRGIPNYMRGPNGPVQVLRMTPMGPMPRNVGE